MSASGHPAQQELLVHVEAEAWLAERLKDHGCDIYAGEGYATYLDRLGACIVRNGLTHAIVGRKDGKPESYAVCFARIAGKPLPKKVDMPKSSQASP